MSRVFITADPHFGHVSMAKHRGFQDEFYHDEHIIDMWNRVVRKKDKVFILGDITMETAKWYFNLDRMNGHKVVVLGNHDMPRDVPELLKYVDSVAGAIKYKGYMLTHIPMAYEELHFYRGNIFGHIHENTHVANSSKRFCVSVDRTNWTPMPFTEIVEQMDKYKIIK